jgi:hypothetical protein
MLASFSGILFGLFIAYFRRYKWACVAGIAIVRSPLSLSSAYSFYDFLIRFFPPVIFSALSVSGA